ncbi:MAG TPA: CBS domain-containing protein [Pyrinomonadaceae bacterium]|nr:CBS domain-containing protein [Pyrinomonadaceae bacterium]
MSRYYDDDDRGYGGRERDRRGNGGERMYGRDDYGLDDYRGGRAGRAGGGLGRDYGYGRDDYGRSGERYETEEYERGGGGGGGYYGEGRGYYRDERESNERRRYEGGGRPLRGRRATRSHVRCRDIMTRDVTVATRETSLQEVAQMMRDEDTGVIPVVERQDTSILASDVKPEEAPRINNTRIRSNGRLVGLITDRDIVIRALAEGRDVREARAEEIMTDDIHSAHPNDRVIDAIRTMGDKQVRRIPVVDDQGNLRGIISMADVALETEEDQELADALEEISSGSSFWSKIFG